MKRFTIALAIVATLMISSTVQAAVPGTADAEYNSNTGEITVSANDVVNWYVGSDSSSLTGDAAANIPAGGGLLTDNDNFVGESAISAFSYADVNIGAVAPPCLDEGDLSVNWNSSLGSSLESADVTYTPLAIYDFVTGEISITTFGGGVVNWYVESASSGLTGSAPAGIPAGGGLLTDNDTRIGESAFAPFSYSVELGAVAATYLPEGDLTINWNYNLGDSTQSSVVKIIPEPTTFALAALGLCSVVAARRRRLV